MARRATRMLVTRATNGYGRGASTVGRSRIGKTYGKLGRLRGPDIPRGGISIGVRVRGRRK